MRGVSQRARRTLDAKVPKCTGTARMRVLYWGGKKTLAPTCLEVLFPDQVPTSLTSLFMALRSLPSALILPNSAGAMFDILHSPGTAPNVHLG